MAIDGVAKPTSKGDETREKIKITALELFARYGVEVVTIRDIAKRANQKSVSSINYYFRSKEDLIVEIIDDTAREYDRMQMVELKKIEKSTAPITIRDILKTLILLDVHEAESTTKLLSMFNSHCRDLMQQIFPHQHDKAYRLCVRHLKKLLLGYDKLILEQRLYFLIPYLWTLLSTRHQSGPEESSFWKEFWAHPAAIENLLDTAEGILVQQPSVFTLQNLD